MHSYIISSPNPSNSLLEIEFKIDRIQTNSIEIQLPAWRPGRYELQNFSKNILFIKAFSSDGLSIEIQKISKERWIVKTEGEHEIKIKYAYYAKQMDAGGSWIDEKMLYINFINCLLYVEGRIDESCKVNLNLPGNYKIASGLDFKDNSVVANDFFHLTDSPLIASPNIKQIKYLVEDIKFNIWVQGDFKIDDEEWKEDFEKFSVVQGRMMNGFPFKHYHFLIILLPYKFYHGVEHHNSTVIVIGNEVDENKELLNFDSIYKKDILGICSHELFHIWNICRIRPKEMLPYDLTKENYFKTGYIAEGTTTYYGDLFLVRSGLWESDEYLQELSQTFNRHFNISNHSHQSLIESSIDLWVDGYSNGIPNKKVSIYHKGSLVAFILDMKIRKQKGNKKSLDDVMRIMWNNYGQTSIGYLHTDYINIIADFIGDEAAHEYEKVFISGNTNLLEELQEAVNYVGCEIITEVFPLFDGGISIDIKIKKISKPEEIENLKQWLNIDILSNI